MKIVKQKTTTYEVLMVIEEPFNTYGRFKEIRLKRGMSLKYFSKCFYCNHNFKDEENVYFAQVTNKGNVFFCKDCVDKYKEE